MLGDKDTAPCANVAPHRPRPPLRTRTHDHPGRCSSLRARILAYAALFGAYQAMWRDYHTIVPALCSTVRTLVREHAVPLATPLCMLSLEEAWYTARRDLASARTLSARVIAQTTLPDESVRVTAQRMLDDIAGERGGGGAGTKAALHPSTSPAGMPMDAPQDGPRPGDVGTPGTLVVPTGARLPNGTHASVRPISMITGRPIYVRRVHGAACRPPADCDPSRRPSRGPSLCWRTMCMWCPRPRRSCGRR